jgi:hypothetical protein
MHKEMESIGLRKLASGFRNGCDGLRVHVVGCGMAKRVNQQNIALSQSSQKREEMQVGCIGVLGRH